MALPVLLLVALAHGTAALDPGRSADQYVHRNWTIEDGLPQNSATGILQDREGYLWISTYGGLSRFDGFHFETFTQVEHGRLPSDRLLSLAEAPDGSLWIGTENSGLARLHRGRFERVAPPAGPPLGGVPALHVGPGGALWIGSQTGLLRYQDGRWTRFPMEGTLEGLQVQAVLETRDGEVLAGTRRGLGILRGGRIEPALDGGGAGSSVFSLLQDRKGAVWIGGDHGRLWRQLGNRTERVELGESGGSVLDILEDRHGRIWIALDPEGLIRLDPGGAELVLRGQRDRGPPSRVISLAEDREGNLWLGTAREGLHQLTRGAALSFGGPDHPLGFPVVPIISDGAGGVWVGLACRGVAHRDAEGRIVRYGTEAGLDNLCVWSLLRDADGTLWIGTQGGGLYRLVGGRVEHLPMPLERQVVQALYRSRRFGLLAGTAHGIFQVLDGGADFRRLPGTEDLHVQYLAEDSGGTLWIATQGGVHALAPEAQRPLPLPTALAGPLADAMVRAIHFDADGAVWIGTYGRGLFRLREGRMAQITTRQGLVENVISWIAEDDRGRLWLTGNRGVQRVPRSQLVAVAEGRGERVRPTHFSAGDGMLISECNGGGQPAGLLEPDGRLWVPTLDGIAVFDTRDPIHETPPPPVRIESITVDGHPLPLAPDRAAGTGSLPPLVLKAGSRNVEIRYTALAFSDPKRIRFRYRLGQDPDGWVEAGRRRIAYYHYLPAGTHRFQVIAGAEDGPWNREGASLDLRIEPRLIDRPSFRLLVVLLVGLGVLGLARLRIAQVRGRERRLEKEVEVRTAELEETRVHLERANRRLGRLATLDPLTGIANRRRLAEQLDIEWRRAVRQGRPIGLLVIDIDHFKPFNDLHGHPAGDRCLKQVVGLLQLQLRRAEDLLARFGGEELVAVLPEVPDRGSLERIAATLRRQVEAAQIPHGASAVSPWVTVSIGGALVLPDLEGDPEKLLAVADSALYAAKRAGRNRELVVDMSTSAAGIDGGDGETSATAGQTG